MARSTRFQLRGLVALFLTAGLTASALAIVSAPPSALASSSDFLIRRISDAAAAQADGAGFDPVISDDASTIVFASNAPNLGVPPILGRQQIFARDRVSGALDLVSTTPGGDPAAGFNYDHRVSADGRWVVFVSDAPDLVADDTNGHADVFVRDRNAGTTVRVTADDAPYTSYGTPQLSDDGATVVLRASAPGVGVLLEGDWQAAPLTEVPNLPTNGFREYALSGDGTTIVMAYQDAGLPRIGFYDRATDAIVDDLSEQMSTQFTISDDASTIAYVFGETFDVQQIRLLQRGATIATVVEDRSFDAEELRQPWLSGDGSTLVYSTYLEECDTGFEGTCMYYGSVYDYDVLTGFVRTVSLPCDGCFESGNSDHASTDETGAWIAFDSSSVDLIEAIDVNNATDVFTAERLGNAAPEFPVDAEITPVTIGATVLEVAWDEATDDVAVTGYEVFVDDTPFATTDPSTGSLTISGLSPATTYVVGIEAFDAADQRSERLTVEVTTASDSGGGTASLLVDSTSATTVGLTWDPADPAELTGYRLFRSTDGVSFDPIADTDATQTSFTDTGLIPLTTYTYRVARLDGTSVGAHTVDTEVTTPPVTVDDVELVVSTVSGAPVAVLGETMSIRVAGAPDLTGDATVTFRSWFSDSGAEQPLPVTRTAMLTLAPRPFTLPGNYEVGFQLVDGITEITDVEVSLTHPGGSSDSAFAAETPLGVSAAIDVTIDAAPDAFVSDPSGLEWTLRATGSTRPPEDVTLSGGGTSRFSGFLGDETAAVDLVTWWGRAETELAGIALVAGRVAEVTIVPRSIGIVVFEVEGPDGEPFNGAQIDVLDDTTGDLIGTRFTGAGGPGISFPEFAQVLAGDTVRLDLSGPGLDPQSMTVSIEAGEQTFFLSAIETNRGTVEGIVLNDDGTPLPGAAVSITQDNVRRDFTAEADGTFSIDAAPGIASIGAGSFGQQPVAQTVVVPEPPDVATVELRLRGVREYLLSLDVYIVEPDGTTSGPEINPNDPDLYLVFNNRATPARPSQIVTAVRGSTYDVCVRSQRRSLGTECTEVTFGDEPELTAEFRFEPAASITGLLADAAGVPVSDVSFAANAARSANEAAETAVSGIAGRQDFRMYLPEPGEWLITIQWGDPANRRGYLYSTFPITLTAGQDLDLGTILPTTQGRFSASGNSVALQPESVLPGETVDVRVAFVNSLSETTNASLLVPVPVGATLLPDGTLVGGEPAASSLDSNRNALVPLGDLGPGERGVVHVRLRIDDPSLDDSPLAVRIVHDESTAYGDLVGVGTLSLVRVTMFGPTRSATGSVPLYGRAPVGSTVTITDAGQNIGEALTSAGGRWNTTVDLDDLGGTLNHELIATTTIDGVDVSSDPVMVDIDPAWPEPFRATLQQEGRTASWDPRAGVATFPFVYHIPNSPITSGGQLVYRGNPITVDVEFDDPDQIRWLVVTVGDTTEPAQLIDGVWHAELAPVELGPVSFAYDAVRRPVTRDDIVLPNEQTLHQRIPSTNGLIVTSVSSGEAGGRVLMEMPVGGQNGLIVAEVGIEAGREFEPSAEQLDQAARAGFPAYVDAFDVELTPDGDSASIGLDLYVLTEFLADSTTPDILDALLQTAVISGGVGIHTLLTIDVNVDVDGVLGSAAGALSVIDALRTGEKYDALDALRQMAESCGDLSTAAFIEINTMLDELVGDAAFIDGVSVVSNIASFALGIGNPLLGAATSLATGALGTLLGSNLESNMNDLKQEMVGLGCECPDAPSAVPRWIYDPSGYVYEGVESNRLEGVTTTVWEGATETGPFVAWDAGPFAQENPLSTEDDGSYGWDVPEGWWQVRYEAPGYLPTESEVLRVLPPHFDVNVGLVPVAAPTVVDAAATSGPSAIDVTFSTYMDPATVDISVAGVAGTAVPLDPEADPDGRTLGRTFRFRPQASLTVGQTVDVTVAASAQDFAGRPLDEAVVWSLVVEPATFAEVTGQVFADDDLSTFPDPVESGIGGVSVDVTDSFGRTERVSTDPTGRFTTSVPTGPVTASVVIHSPALVGLGLTSSNLTQTVPVDAAGGEARPVGFAPITGPLAELTVEVAPASVPEGSAVAIDAEVIGASGPTTVGLDLDGDGRSDTPFGVQPIFDASGADGPQLVEVDVVASDGRRSGSAMVAVEVTNVAPSVVANDVEQTDSAESLDVATFRDPGVADTHTAVIDWGDGGSTGPVVAAGGVVSAVHEFPEAGTYDVTTCVTDDDGDTTCAIGTVTVVVDDDDCTITGTEGRDILFGTAGDDVICALGGNDVILAFGGNDLVRAGAGNDLVISGSGGDTVEAGTGNDVVNGGSGPDEIDGGDGRDLLFGASGPDVIRGGDGNDWLFGNSDDDELFGEAGHDFLVGGSGSDLLDGGSDSDRCFGSRSRDRFVAC